MSTSNYVSGQILTAAELNASFDSKADSTNTAISGGYLEALDHIYITGTSPSTSPFTGALTVADGLGVAGALNVGGAATAASVAATGGVTAATGVFSGKTMAANGSNVLLNSTGEFGNTGWSSSNFASTTDINADGFFFSNLSAISAAAQDGQSITIGANVHITISAEIASENVAAGRCYVAVEAFNSANASLGIVATALSPNGSVFTIRTGTGQTPANTSYVTVWKGADTSPSIPALALKFRRIKLEAGSTPSTYSQEASLGQVPSMVTDSSIVYAIALG